MNIKAKIIILASIITLIPIGVFVFIKYYPNNSIDNRQVSKNILYVSQPVFSFSGKIEKVDGNILTVSRDQAIETQIPITNPTQAAPIASPKIVKLTYKVIVDDSTQINQPSLPTIYLFRSPTPVNPLKSSVQDLAVDQQINIVSKDDLRTLSSDAFTATLIDLPPKNTSLNGTITKIDNNVIVINATPLNNVPLIDTSSQRIANTETKEYIIKINQDTEVSRFEGGVLPKAEKLSFSDLKINMPVVVYTNSDVATGSTFDALRIEPSITKSPSNTPQTTPIP